MGFLAYKIVLLTTKDPASPSGLPTSLETSTRQDAAASREKRGTTDWEKGRQRETEKKGLKER